MKLKEYLTTLKIDPTYLAAKAGISKSSIYAYLGGTNSPSQDVAERIEDVTMGAVTVLELRGKDNRCLPKPRKKS